MKKIISFAMVIATLLSITTVAYAKVGPFEDVNSNAYYAEAVQWAYENGVTSGTSSTTFSPNSTCTRGQVVTFLWNMNGKPKVDIQNPFTDVTTDKYYHNAVLWAYQQGIVAGTSATTFSPDNTCTKEHILVMLWRSLGSPKVNNVAVNCSDWSKDAVMWAQSSGVAVGINGKDNCPRADIIYYIYNTVNAKNDNTNSDSIPDESNLTGITKFYNVTGAIMNYFGKGDGIGEEYEPNSTNGVINTIDTYTGNTFRGSGLRKVRANILGNYLVSIDVKLTDKEKQKVNSEKYIAIDAISIEDASNLVSYVVIDGDYYYLVPFTKEQCKDNGVDADYYAQAYYHNDYLGIYELYDYGGYMYAQSNTLNYGVVKSNYMICGDYEYTLDIVNPSSYMITRQIQLVRGVMPTVYVDKLGLENDMIYTNKSYYTENEETIVNKQNKSENKVESEEIKIPKEKTIDEKIEEEIEADKIHANAIDTEVEKYSDGTYRVYWVYEDIDTFLADSTFEGSFIGECDAGYIIIKHGEVFTNAGGPIIGNGYFDGLHINKDVHGAKGIVKGDILSIKGHIRHYLYRTQGSAAYVFRMDSGEVQIVERANQNYKEWQCENLENMVQLFENGEINYGDKVHIENIKILNIDEHLWYGYEVELADLNGKYVLSIFTSNPSALGIHTGDKIDILEGYIYKADDYHPISVKDYTIY